MKKLLSIIMALALLVTGFAFPVSAEEEPILADISEDMISIEGATLEFDPYLNAYKITPDAVGNDVKLYLTESLYYLALWLPATAADTKLSLTVENDVYLSNTELCSSHKFSGVGIGFEGENFIMTYTPTDIYSIYLYAKMGNYDCDKDLLAAANGSLDAYAEEELVLDSYEVDRYTDYFWNEDIVYNESFFPIYNENGEFEPIEMMYEIDRVISVQDAYLEKEYVYGKDYTIEDGKLMIPEGSSIRVYNHSQVYKDNTMESGWWKTLTGSYIFAGQYNMYFVGYLNISYTVKGTWNGVVPESKATYLERSLSKLESGAENFKVLAIGDSISGGANVSANLEVEPYADVWSTMTAKALQEKYPETAIEYDTIAQGGATASLAIEKMSEILAFAPDLLFIEFGTNECMQGDSATVYINTLKQAISAVNANLPDCDIVLLAPYFSNPLLFPADWFYSYADALYGLERDGVAVCDIVSVIQYVLTKKDYLDITGDNLCHPNDFTSRIITQTLLKTLEYDTDESNYIAGLADRLLTYRYENEFYPAEWEEFTAKAAEASAEVAACTSAEAALALFIEKAAELDSIPSAKDVDANAALDCSKIIYNNAKAYETVTATSNLSAQYDADSKALILTINYARNPIATIGYGVGDSPVYADNYGYAIVTARVPATNGTRSTTSKFTFTTSAGSTASKSVSLTRDDAYHSYIIDLTGEANWTGTVSSLAYQAFASSTAGDQLCVSSIILATDLENAMDIAIERERTANANSAEAVTLLMADNETSALLQPESSDSYLAGDANGDGILTAKDVVYLRRNLAGYDDTDVDLTALDMDANGSLETADCIILRQVLVGLINEYIIGGASADVTYDESEKAAKLVLAETNATVTADISNLSLSADMFKYITVCAKNDDASALGITVTLTTDKGTYTDTVCTQDLDSFTADSGKFVDATGNILSVSFTFDAEAGSTVYFDSFVLTPTLSAAENAEVVRVGAANLN